MERKRPSGESTWVDPEDAPELTDEYFEHADLYHGETLIRRGRPKLAKPKRQVTLRLDADVLEGMRATGPGWQTRANEALRKWVQRQRKAS